MVDKEVDYKKLWMDVYVACIRGGESSTYAKEQAERAVKNMKEAEQKLEL